jgi:hypothetical protein
MLVSFWYVLYTAIIHKTRPLPLTLLYRESAVNAISYNKCTIECLMSLVTNLETIYLKDLEEGGGGKF